MRYLTHQNEAAVADHWYPRDARKQARVDEYMEWQHMNIRLHCSTYFWLKWLLPTMFGKIASDGRLAEAKAQMEQTLDFVENVWLAGGKQRFLTGDVISVADLLGACEVEQTRKCARGLNKLVFRHRDTF